ncbi:ABC transporter ATP-binding protein [Niastella koreensis]|uniref:ABC transporter ATP-binding protein n=1 Tax=Niastella koreensis TaxID=354356 RepID=UPI0021CDF777|nr:ATP-binding cassette domain-containing protein [Niastella koreensis]
MTFSMEKGSVYALLGSNGAGKTTLFNLITGFIRPAHGEIVFNTEKITSLPPFQRNRMGIGRTFQHVRLIGRLTVLENLILAMPGNKTDHWGKALLPGFLYRASYRPLQEKAYELCERFFLSQVKHARIAEISYGQQKLLSLACCVANGASMLLLDEVVAGIQPEYRRKIAMIIRQLKEEGKTIFFIEHNIEFVSEIADSIFFLHEGKITVFKNVEVFRKDKQVMDAYT